MGALDALLDRREDVFEALLVVGIAQPETELGQLQPRQVLGVAAELDVDAAAGHVGGNGHRAGLAGLGDGLGLVLGMLGLGVEHRVLDALLVQPLGEQLGDLDGDRPHQHRLATLVALGDLVDHRRPLAALGLVDLVVAVLAHHRLVGGHLGDGQLVDLHELGGLGQGGAGHAAELLVHAEVVLQRDRRERLVLLLDGHLLLGLDRLVQALRPAPALEDAAGELVDDLHLAVDHLVLDAALVERLGLERLDQVVDEVAVLGPVEVVDPEELLGLGDAALGDRHGLVLLVELEVEVRHELLLGALVHARRGLAGLHLRRQAGELGVEVGCLLRRAGDDQRGPRLVDEDVVDLVDDRELVGEGVPLAVGVDVHPVLGLLAGAVLDLLLERGGHVVAQVVEPELRIRSVGHVGGVGGLLVLVGLHVLQDPHRHPEGVVDRLHPLGVPAGEVVVDRHEVHAVAGERVQDDRERGGERLALPRLHLGDRPVVQHHAADHLHVEVAQTERALGRLARQREALVQQVVEGLAVAGPLTQLLGLLAELLDGEELHLGLEGVDAVDPLGVALVLLGLAEAKRAVKNAHTGLA